MNFRGNDKLHGPQNEHTVDKNAVIATITESVEVEVGLLVTDKDILFAEY